MTIWELFARLLLIRHRSKQEAIAFDVERGVAFSWRYVQFASLDESQVPFLDSALPKVKAAFEQSQMATGSFLSDYRNVALSSQGVDAPGRPTWTTATKAVQPSGVDMKRLENLTKPGFSGVDLKAVEHLMAPAFDERKAAADLMAAGVGAVKRSMPAPEDIAMSNGLKGAAGAAVRDAMDGGRGVALAEAQEDELAMGWQRATDSDPCYFCALLAANGPVYASRKSFTRSNKKFDPNLAFEATGEPDGIAKVHNHCRCQLIPVYEGFEQEDPWGKVALQLWRKVTGEGYSGREAMREYRRTYGENLKSDDPISGDAISEIVVKQRIYEALKDVSQDSDAVRTARALKLVA